MIPAPPPPAPDPLDALLAWVLAVARREFSDRFPPVAAPAPAAEPLQEASA